MSAQMTWKDRARAAEAENDRLRNENALLKQGQHKSCHAHRAKHGTCRAMTPLPEDQEQDG